jgi:antitoxin component of RelBE/YafQ-DinJ toxin-antitoxin module
MATLRIVNIPDEVKERFRLICKRQGTTMSNAVLDFMKESVGEEIMQEAVARFRRRHYRK